jgi:hypothetical protein
VGSDGNANASMSRRKGDLNVSEEALVGAIAKGMGTATQ